MRYRLTASILTVVALAGALAASAAATTSSGRGGAAAADDPGVSASQVTFGMIYDQTGPTATTQSPFAHGIQAYLKLTNDKGGVAGRKIDYKTCDEKFAPDPALGCLRTFTNDQPVFALLGSLNAGSFQPPGSPLVERAKMPVLGPQAIQQAVQESKNPYIFHMACSYADMADVAVPFGATLTKKKKPKVITIGLDVSGGYEFDARVKERVAKIGGTYLGHQVLGPSATDADAQAQAIANAKPDYIVMHASTGSAVIVLKALAKFGVTAPVIANGPAGAESVYLAVGTASGARYYSVNCYTPASIKVAGTAAMVAAANQYGFSKDADNVNFTQGWVVGMTAVAALKKAGKNLTRDSFRSGITSLHKLPTGGLSGDVQFSAKVLQGVSEVRPYKYNYAKGKIIQVGSYAQWAKNISHQYAK
jgi:branched-chain amino acid transport system substrate-binding protein